MQTGGNLIMKPARILLERVSMLIYRHNPPGLLQAFPGNLQRQARQHQLQEQQQHGWRHLQSLRQHPYAAVHSEPEPGKGMHVEERGS